MATKIQVRRDTTTAFANVVLSEGEPAYDTTAKKLKVGDGSSKFSALPYIGGSDSDNDTTYKLTLNGTQKGSGTTDLGSFYAPTSAGTSGYFLKSSGSGAPAWSTLPTASSSTAGILKIGTTSSDAAAGNHTHSEYSAKIYATGNGLSGSSQVNGINVGTGLTASYSSGNLTLQVGSLTIDGGTASSTY